MRALSVLLLLACGGGGGLEIEGTPGTPVPARLEGNLPYTRVTLEGFPEQLLICDTGSPITVLDASVFPGLGEGAHEVDLAALGVTFRGATVAALALPDTGVGAGLLGADLLGLFAFTIDYRDARLWITSPYDVTKRPGDVAVGPEVALAAEVRGGGRARLPGCGGAGCGTVDLAPTRFLTRMTLEAQAAPIWVLIDSGASGVVMDETTFASLGGERPRLEGLLVGTVEGELPGFLSRVWRARLEGADDPSSQVAVDDLPIIVVPGLDLLADLSDEVDLPIGALVGGHLLRHHLTTVDTPARRLRLAPYLDPRHIDADEFIGVAVTFYRDGDDWRVLESFTDRDAWNEGLRPDDYVEEIDGMPVRGQPGEVIDAALGRFGLGQEVPITFRNLGGRQTVNVLVEDLLPHLGPPA